MKNYTKKDIIIFIVVAAVVALLVVGIVIYAVYATKKEDEIYEGEVSITIDCSAVLGNMELLDPALTSYIPSNGKILVKTTIGYVSGDSVLEVLKRVCKENNIRLDYSHTVGLNTQYVKGIGFIYEFSCGAASGWKYKVNGEYASVGSDSYKVATGDDIVWEYTV